MRFRITLIETDEGWAASCPDLLGCHSQGATREEAVLNIREAVRLWLEVEAEENGVRQIIQEEIAI